MTVAATMPLTVRPPWPDEISRLKAFLAGSLQGAKAVHLLVLVAADPERIVGAAAVRETTEGVKDGSAEIALKARPRQLENGGARMLMDAVLDKALTLGYKKLVAAPATGAPHIPLLRKYGFERVKTEELWQVELNKMKIRLDRLVDRVRLPQEWSVRTPNPADLPQLVELSATYGFLQADRIQFDGPGDAPGTHFDAAGCTVIENEGHIIAALLAKGGIGGNGHIDARMVHPSAMQMSGALNLHLLHHSIKAGLSMGFSTVTLTVNTSRDRETRNLARRTGGKCIQSKDLLHLGEVRSDAG